MQNIAAWHPCFLLTALCFISFLLFSNPTASDPQAKFLDRGCSQYNATNRAVFFNNLNASFAYIRSQLSSTTRFVTTVSAHVSDPVYALFQCRDYLSAPDCLACFSIAASQIRNCSAANGARIIYDGCFLRYESNNFYDQTTQQGRKGFCGNQTVKAVGFNRTADKLLLDLVAATPRMEGYFGAARREGAGGAVVYGMAQCVHRVDMAGCQECLRVAYGNIQQCPPDGDGRAMDVGCFMRYSSRAFFNATEMTDIVRFLKGSSSKSKKAIIGGAVGGAAFLILLLLSLLLLLLRHLRTSKKKPQKGDILEATELRGPVNFHYKDLKSATRNFSAGNKVGGGGFGDVYKGALKDGKMVAVKKLALSRSSSVQAEFESEAKLISNVHHRNLIRLLGCCSKGKELLLVYEFMKNGSLDKFIFGIVIFLLSPQTLADEFVNPSGV
ncbi:hypothetical protein ACLOJK_017213 [Asimina triloba]